MYSKGIVGLSDADFAALAEIVADVEKSQELLAAAQAAQIRALARAGDLARKQAGRALARVREHDMALRAIAAEMAGAMKTTDRSVQRQIGEATELVEDYPSTLRAWEEGVIIRGPCARHRRYRPDPPARPARPRSRRPPFPNAKTRRRAASAARLELLAERLHPRTLTERHRDAREQRDIRVMTLADGMSA